MGGNGIRSTARRRPRARGVALAVVLLLCGVSGCSDDAVPQAQPTPADSASSVPSSSGATPSPVADEESTGPELPARPRAKNTPGGRRAFAEFVVSRWGYALATNDATALTRLSANDGLCQGCPQLRAELRKRERQGWFVDFPGAEVERVAVEPGDTEGTWAATARIAVPASRSYFDDGSFRNENEAHPRVDFEVRMRHQGGRFVLLGFSID